MATKRSGGYFFLGMALVKRKDPIEMKPTEHTEYLDENEVRRKLQSLPQRERSQNSEDIILEFIQECREEGSENLCFVKDCRNLIANADVSLFCREHNIKAYNTSAPIDLYPKGRGYVFPEPKRRGGK